MFLWIKHSDIIENRLEWKELETGNVPCIELGSVKHSLVVTEKNEKKSGDEEEAGRERWLPRSHSQFKSRGKYLHKGQISR